MEIKYMTQLRDNPNISAIGRRENWNISQIEELEIKYNNDKPFPIAFREYLYLAGDWGGTGVVNEDWDDLYKDCKEDMEYCGYSLERPYFIFDNYSSQYSIFYLDDTREDPKIYILDPFGKIEGEEPLVRENLQGTFTNLINEAIYRKKNDLLF